jgi:GxxExxY protein
VTDRIIGAAIEVHRRLGPGFLENAYEEAMCLELQERHIPFQQQVSVNVRYRGVIVDRHRMDLVVESKVVVELKAVRQVEDLHLAVALAYLRAAGLTTGLILNFSEAKLRVRRVVKSLRATAEAPRCDSAEDMVGAANGAPGAASVSRPE